CILALFMFSHSGLVRSLARFHLFSWPPRASEIHTLSLHDALPIFKYPVMRFAFNQFGERAKTLTLSNLGNIQLPESMRPYADSMDVVLYPTNKSPINCGTATVNDKLTITFSRSIEENKIIKKFFKEITRLTGLDVTVSSNGWGE